MDGPVRFFLPEGGVSMLDAPGQPFHDPAADAALFEALEQTVRQTSTRQLVRLPLHLNDPAFSDALAAAFEALAGARTSRTREVALLPAPTTHPPAKALTCPPNRGSSISGSTSSIAPTYHPAWASVSRSWRPFRSGER